MPAIIYHQDEWEKNGYSHSHPEMVIEPGCVVKLRNPLNESFFVVVQYRYYDKWIGKVNNYLVNGSVYNFDDLVIFGEKDVYDFKSLETVEKQKKGHLVLALRLMLTYLKEMGVIRDEMSRNERIEIIDYFIMKYPKKLLAILKLVGDLSKPEEDQEEEKDE